MDLNLQTVAQVIEETDTSEMEGKYLTFWIDGQFFGIPISDVVQIVGMQVVTEIPEFPQYAKGIIDLRGTIITVIDVRLRIGKLEVPYNERTCIIVTHMEERNIGFIVDEVDSVLLLNEEEIAPPPQLSDNVNKYITGVGKLENKIVLLMDTRMMAGEAMSKR